jgi:hypothetical protein
MTKGEYLGDISSERKPKKVQLRKAERVNEVRRVVRHRLNGPGGFAARTRHARIVKEDHRSVFCESVGDGGIPMVQATAKVLHE